MDTCLDSKNFKYNLQFKFIWHLDLGMSMVAPKLISTSRPSNIESPMFVTKCWPCAGYTYRNHSISKKIVEIIGLFPSAWVRVTVSPTHEKPKLAQISRFITVTCAAVSMVASSYLPSTQTLTFADLHESVPSLRTMRPHACFTNWSDWRPAIFGEFKDKMSLKVSLTLQTRLY